MSPQNVGPKIKLKLCQDTLPPDKRDLLQAAFMMTMMMMMIR